MSTQNFRASVASDQAPLWLLQVLNVIGIAGTLVLNFLANALPINGKNTGQLSDQYPNLFTPAGFTFSIWSVIYLLLLGFGFYQVRDLLHSTKDQIHQPAIRKIGYLFFVSCLANMSWILAWHYEYVGLSVLIMVVLFACLLTIYNRLHTSLNPITGQEYRITKVLFSIYLAWITVAMIANITAWLVDSGWRMGLLSEQTWAILVVLVATGIGLFLLVMHRNIAFAVVIIWALVGILAKRIISNEPHTTGLIFMTILCAAAICVGIWLVLTHRTDKLEKRLRETA